MQKRKQSEPIYGERPIIGWWHYCAWCGVRYKARRKDSETCSSSCRGKLARARARGEG